MTKGVVLIIKAYVEVVLDENISGSNVRFSDNSAYVPLSTACYRLKKLFEVLIFVQLHVWLIYTLASRTEDFRHDLVRKRHTVPALV